MQDPVELNRSIPFPIQTKRKKAWLIVPENGDSNIEDLGKHLIMRRTGISAHDLRVLDPDLSYTSTILRRERAIVVRLEHIKAIITAAEILVPNPIDPTLESFVWNLKCSLLGLKGTRKI
ncbi:unnamed protein product [Ilex paraguariensis]|uniref:Uncharacterized protein n=1 Tax=Ilex paraguariensis TaxID=185542 RepID=A0ABC8S9P1_9AQUA